MDNEKELQNDLQQEQKQPKKWKSILWILGFFVICGAAFLGLGYQVYVIDPLFHFRAPDINKYYYELNSERYQNDGILRHFDYDAIITGTSMSQNFKTSEFDELFDVNSVKTTFSGGSFREVGDRLKTALASNDKIKIVVRSLDMDFFFQDYDDLGTMADGDYPEYLYDNNKFNDYKYLLNRDVIFNRVYNIRKNANSAEPMTGMTNFDWYSNWMGICLGQFGCGHVIQEDLFNGKVMPFSMTQTAQMKIKRNITYNFLEIAEEYPDVEFYVFVTPYSAAWWNLNIRSAAFLRQIQAEQYIIELMLPYENIHLFSFNTFYYMTTDLNNYKDSGHYGDWVNSAILRWMKEGTGELTEENYLEYIRTEYALYSGYDYVTLNDQNDYENDEDAAFTIKAIYFPELLQEMQQQAN